MNRAHEIIDELRAEIANTTPAELPAIIGQVEAVKAEAFARLVSNGEPGGDEDRLVSVDETAALLGQTSRWVRDHAKELPLVRLPGRTLRFSEKRLANLIKRQRRG